MTAAPAAAAVPAAAPATTFFAAGAAPRPLAAGVPLLAGAPLVLVTPRFTAVPLFGGLVGTTTGARPFAALAAVGFDNRLRSGAGFFGVSFFSSLGGNWPARASEAAVGANKRDVAPDVDSRGLAGVEAEGVLGRAVDVLGRGAERGVPIGGRADGVLDRTGVLGRTGVTLTGTLGGPGGRAGVDFAGVIVDARECAREAAVAEARGAGAADLALAIGVAGAGAGFSFAGSGVGTLTSGTGAGSSAAIAGSA